MTLVKMKKQSKNKEKKYTENNIECKFCNKTIDLNVKNTKNFSKFLLERL